MTVAPNANCSVSILFSPSQAAAEHASLQVSTNAPGSPQAAALTGTGIAAQGGVTLSPGSVDFGPLAQGATESRSVQVTNSGSGVLHIASIALSGSNPNDFSQMNSCVSGAIAVHASCTITVNFAPQTQGQRTASLVISDDGAGSPQSVALGGSGAVPFQLTLASGSTSAAASAGQTAQYALQALAGPGFTGSVSLTCSGAPLAATCNVTPNNISLSGSSATLLQVSVTTTGNAVVLQPGIKFSKFWNLPFALAGVIAVLWTLLFLKADAKQGAATRVAYAAMFLGMALLVAAGCGGGGGGTRSATPQARTVTPHGTTTLTVAAQSGTLPAETLQLTLTVN